MSKPDWLQNLESELQIANARSLIIVVVATLHDELRELVKLHLRPGRTSEDELFGSSKPLSGFSATIAIAERLGILEDQVASVLHIFRRMRNDCAHASVPIDLDRPPFSDQVREMRRLHYSIVELDAPGRHSVIVLAANLISAVVDAQRNKQLKEKHSGKPHESKLWIRDGILRENAFPLGARP